MPKLTPPSPVQVLAILKGLKGPDEAPEPGEYSIRGLARVRLDCVVTQAASYKARAPVKLDAARLLNAACVFAGVPIDAIPGIIERAVHAAALVRPPSDQKQQLDLAAAAIDRAKKKIPVELEPKKGALKVSGLVELEKLDAST